MVLAEATAGDTPKQPDVYGWRRSRSTVLDGAFVDEPPGVEDADSGAFLEITPRLWLIEEQDVCSSAWRPATRSSTSASTVSA